MLDERRIDAIVAQQNGQHGGLQRGDAREARLRMRTRHNADFHKIHACFADFRCARRDGVDGIGRQIADRRADGFHGITRAQRARDAPDVVDRHAAQRAFARLFQIDQIGARAGCVECFFGSADACEQCGHRILRGGCGSGRMRRVHARRGRLVDGFACRAEMFDGLRDPVPGDAFVRPCRFIDCDLQVGHFVIDLVGGQHEEPAHEDRAFDDSRLRAVEAAERRVCFRVDAAHVEEWTLWIVGDVVELQFCMGQWMF
ncbi:hypothetical protein PSAB6_290003 [Paraburkholderia sabiae]|nr:hypothetical protein PSAB6_290003 [Paraburkholderia sabiae]